MSRLTDEQIAAFRAYTESEIARYNDPDDIQVRDLLDTVDALRADLRKATILASDFAEVNTALREARAEVEALTARVGADSARAHGIWVALVDALRQRDELEREVESLTTQRDRNKVEFDRAVATVATLRARAEQAEAERDAAERDVQTSVMASRDVAAQLQGAWNAERARAEQAETERDALATRIEAARALDVALTPEPAYIVTDEAPPEVILAVRSHKDCPTCGGSGRISGRKASRAGTRECPDGVLIEWNGEA